MKINWRELASLNKEERKFKRQELSFEFLAINSNKRILSVIRGYSSERYGALPRKFSVPNPPKSSMMDLLGMQPPSKEETMAMLKQIEELEDAAK